MNTATDEGGVASLQRALQGAIRSVGGYWPPLSAVARLLEELGELADAAYGYKPDRSTAIGEELADLWIISTCLASQYCIELAEAEQSPVAQDVGELLLRGLRCAGEIARTINYYDGPKNPRTLEGWVPLGRQIRKFHEVLFELADQCRVQLRTVVQQKITTMATRDATRFKPGFDPSTAPSLVAFRRLVDRTACPFAHHARLWGTPTWNSLQTIEQNTSAITAVLTALAKCARYEQIDGLVAQMPECLASDRFDNLGTLLNRVLRTLCEMDEVNNRSFASQVDEPGWQFEFRDVRFFISVFSPHYPANHPRHSPDDHYIFFQPESSFADHGFAEAPGSKAKKQRIRRAFAAEGMWYPSETIDSRIEANIYLPPRSDSDEALPWWLPREQPV